MAKYTVAVAVPRAMPAVKRCAFWPRTPTSTSPAWQAIPQWGSRWPSTCPHIPQLANLVVEDTTPEVLNGHDVIILALPHGASGKLASQLDPNAVKQFLFLLGRVNRELGITVVIATHSPEDVEAYATQRIDLDASGAPAPRESAEAALAPRWEARAAACAHADAAIRVRDAHFRFDRREPWVLRGIDLNIARGCVHALVGGNGRGKTTLLRSLAGVLKPQRGHIDNALRHSQALLPQDPRRCSYAIRARGAYGVVDSLRLWAA